MNERTPLEGRQEKVFNAIRREARDRRRPVSLDEIAEAAGLFDRSAARKYVLALQEKGYLRQLPGHRGVEVVGEAVGRTLKIYGEVSCGEPMPCDDGEPDEIDLEKIFDPEDVTLLKARGESMLDAHIAPGDFVAIHKHRAAKNGDAVIARVNGNITLKKLVRRKSAGAQEDWLHSCNAQMKLQPFRLNPDNGDEILGVYAGMIRVAKKGCC